MKVKTKTVRRILKVEIPSCVDYKKLAVEYNKRLGPNEKKITESLAWYWISTKNIPEKSLAILEDIKLTDVSKERDK